MAVLFCVLLLGACCAVSHPVINLDEHKTALLDYQRSGAYARDVAQADARAQAYILAYAAVTHPAIVLDIDETSLSNWPELVANNLTFRMNGPCDHLPKGPCGLDAWDARSRAAAIAPTLALFRAARAHGVTVFFLTGRDEKLRAATVRNLHNAGYDGWKMLIMRPGGTTTKSAADYKAPRRAWIERQGYTVIATIGDQWSDLAGGHALQGFLIPNPFYRIP